MKIVIIDGHPDAAKGRLCHALADAYQQGAEAGEHEVRRIAVADLDFPLLRSAQDFTSGMVPTVIDEAQKTIRWAEHVVVVYPLWLGTLPAVLKGFFEQVLRPGFAFHASAKGWPEPKLKGRSARIIVTMGMPAFAYRWFYGAHSLKSFERNILKFVGFGPIRETLLGNVAGATEKKREKWMREMRRLGERGR